jgi:hypothetical protein
MDSNLAILFSLALPVAGAGHLIDMMPVISWASSSPLSSPSTRTGFNQASKASEVFFDAPKFPEFEAWVMSKNEAWVIFFYKSTLPLCIKDSVGRSREC